MADPIARQLDAIQSMLLRGQRNLRMERHSLILWGLAGALLFACSDTVLTAEQIPDASRRATAWLLFISTVLGGVGVADWHLTRRVKQARDETWSFIHRQVVKLLWLLMGVGTLFTFATFFYGGAYMLCTVWLVLIGLALYVHGLFSEEVLEWAGGTIILIGVAGLVARLPFETMKWIAIAVFGLGLPLLSALLDHGRTRSFGVRLAQSAGWTVLVLAAPLAAHRYASTSLPPELPVMSLAEFMAGGTMTGERIVQLPAGTRVPVRVQVSGDLFRPDPDAVLPLVLDRPVELLLRDGALTGDVRAPGGPWQLARETRWISIPWIRAGLEAGRGPSVDTALVVDFHGHPFH
ncbi:MAG TPA: hypothetical protein PLN96_05650 [Zoogloea sp.]|uniref:hypothetical protein n=1 Tax=Zoogloea sp. TaxID=49181 RepID=UPI002CC4EA14|nr:hypothetical protein [Zoogloea sp.]HMY50530.1 hypothetical protein [Rhodocyclaceae bacterium]HNA67714.1 hypothetical protein [Rhodocyclaceae bacterium]HNB64278.1 hypothetical protein [Rhodocyclaceae bacterium]HND23623.1 hypothetical protein [Rhodocyclaceae bacterium]HNH17244.1 hypothetical protein [Zoogloea sp.]